MEEADWAPGLVAQKEHLAPGWGHRQDSQRGGSLDEAKNWGNLLGRAGKVFPGKGHSLNKEEFEQKQEKALDGQRSSKWLGCVAYVGAGRDFLNFAIN